ncbi:MAG: cell division protein ZapA [Candidatus Kapabacteria bacterium]|nr:cell division protein ZapA [Candidatus Kapabacteria bacterium]
MAHKIKVNIGGIEYPLVGDDPELIQSAAAEVDEQVSLLRKTLTNEPMTTLSILAALNIAEKNYVLKKQNNENRTYLSNEINKMNDYLNQSLNLNQKGISN